MFSGIGFFHYGSRDKKQPVDVLEACLKNPACLQEEEGRALLAGSLLVLPEAFNIEASYLPDEGPFNTDQRVKCRLTELASRYGITFVAGLIVKEPESGSKERGSGSLPFNSAWLIGGSSIHLLSRKFGEDNLANKLYAPDRKTFNEPILVGETVVSALICMDAVRDRHPQTGTEELHGKVRASVAALGGSETILCIPANSRYHDFSRPPDDWPDCHWVVAEGGGFGKPSIIKRLGHDPILFSGKENKVMIASFKRF